MLPRFYRVAVVSAASWFWGGVGDVAMSGCAPPAQAEPHAPATTLDAVAVGERLLERLRHGESPAGVDGEVQALAQLGEQEGAGARHTSALRLGADLLVQRFRITRDHRDLEQAERWLSALGASGDAERCRALEASGTLEALAGDRAAARERYLRYERECRTESDMAHVHASLALLDPAVALASSEAAHRPVPPAAGPRRRFHRIVLDAGHGGNDPGARGATGLAESAVTLDVARRTAALIADRLGAEVILTRDAEQFVPLDARAEFANDAGADLFLSIHCNSSDNPSSRGVSTYILDTASDRVAARLAARENAAQENHALADPNVFRILANLRLVGLGSRSHEVAAALQATLVGALRQRYADAVDLGIHPARFNVLVGARMPAVLVELSFVSNPTEEQRLRSAEYRDLLARAIVDGLAALEQK